MEDQEYVGMREPSLLELDHRQMCSHRSQHVSFEQIIHQFVVLSMKHAGSEVWSIGRFLSLARRSPSM